MGFYHNTAVATTYNEIMHGLWLHASSGSSPITIASEGGNSATWNGAAFATPSASSFWGTSGSYMVLSCPRPDGGVAQLKIAKTATVALEFAPNGGWQSSDGTFGAALTGGSVACFDVAPTTSDAIRVSSDDTDTYGSGPHKATGLCAWWYDASAGTMARGFYFGNMLPKNPTDTKPVVLMSKIPATSNAATANLWSNTGSSNNINLAFADSGRTTLGWATMWSHSRADTVQADHDGYAWAGELSVECGAAAKWVGNLPPNLLRRVGNGFAVDTLIGGGKWRTSSTGLAMRVAA